MFLEYLKKHRKNIAIRLGVSFGAVCVLFAIIIGIVLSNPLSQAGLFAFIMLLTPPGFGFFIFGLILVMGLLGTTLWVGVDYYRIRTLRHEVNRIEHLNEDQSLNLWDEPEHIEDPASNQIILLTQEKSSEESDEAKEAAGIDYSIEAFAKQAEKVITMIQSIYLQPTAQDQVLLENQLNALRKYYYQLARMYHPDLERDEEQKVLKKGEFQRLSKIYDNVQQKCNQLKDRIQQQLNPTKAYQEQNAMYQEQNELLRETSGLLQEQNELLEKCNELLRNFLKMLEQQAADNRQLSEKIEKLERKVTNLEQQPEGHVQILEEHKSNNAFFDAKLAEMQKEEEQRYKFLKQLLLSQQRSDITENISITTTHPIIASTTNSSEPPTPTQSCILF